MSTLFSVGRVTVNAHFMQEMKEVNDEFWMLLSKTQYTCTRPISLGDNGRRFVEMLQELQDQLALYFALEEAYGDPLDMLPHSAACEAEELRGEHRPLYREFSEIVERAETMLKKEQPILLASRIPCQFLAFHEKLMNHEHGENELRSAVLYRDIGAGD